jgi:hypothetical protein
VGLIIRTLLAYPFLQGRCLFLASRFAELLPADVRGQYFEAAVQVIESSETEIPFKVSAVKSIQQFVVFSLFKSFCVDRVRSSFAEYISDAELAIVPRIIRDLGPFLVETTEDTLSLVLETVSVLSGVGRGSWFTLDLAVALTSALLDVWPKNMKGLFWHHFHTVNCADSPGRPDLLVSTQRYRAFNRQFKGTGCVRGNSQAGAAEAHGFDRKLQRERIVGRLVGSGAPWEPCARCAGDRSRRWLFRRDCANYIRVSWSCRGPRCLTGTVFISLFPTCPKSANAEVVRTGLYS